MFTIFLRSSDNKSEAPRFMDGHNAWIQKGFEDGVFLMVGGLQPNAGGAILAHNVDREALEQRVQNDPFVAEGVVVAEIHEIKPARTDERLSFLAA